MLQADGFPDINFISKKAAFEGMTRFEDRNRLPLSICVNLTAFSAKMLTQTAYSPQVSYSNNA